MTWKRSGGEGGIRTHGDADRNQQVHENPAALRPLRTPPLPAFGSTSGHPTFPDGALCPTPALQTVHTARGIGQRQQERLLCTGFFVVAIGDDRAAVVDSHRLGQGNLRRYLRTN